MRVLDFYNCGGKSDSLLLNGLVVVLGFEYYLLF